MSNTLLEETCNCGAETGAIGERGPVCDNGHDIWDYNARYEDIRSEYAKRTGTTVSMEPFPDDV